MSDAAHFDPIFDLVLETIEEFCECSADPSELTKTVLVNDGHYCGRAFHYRDIRAVWFAEANELKFYRDRGPLLRAVRLDGASRLCRAA
jgi:hypothetical protein